MTIPVNKTHLSNPAMTEVVRSIQDALDLQYVYVRPEGDYEGYVLTKGGLTIAYSQQQEDHSDQHNIVWVSLAWCNPDEDFNKMLGKFFAATRYEAKNSVPIRLPEKGNVSLQLKELFQVFL